MVSAGVLFDEPLEDKVSFLHQRVQSLKVALNRLSPFLQIEGDNFVQESIINVLQLGWESVKFAHGYSILHYACECMNSPAIVDLLFNLSTDPCKPDDAGMRPLDYAVTAGHPGVVSKMNELLGIDDEDVQPDAKKDTPKRRPTLIAGSGPVNGGAPVAGPLSEEPLKILTTLLHETGEEAVMQKLKASIDNSGMAFEELAAKEAFEQVQATYRLLSQVFGATGGQSKGKPLQRSTLGGKDDKPATASAKKKGGGKGNKEKDKEEDAKEDAAPAKKTKGKGKGGAKAKAKATLRQPDSKSKAKAEFTKPKLIPRKKMKKFHWLPNITTSMLFGSRDLPREGTVYENVEDFTNLLDIDELEELWMDKPPVVPNSAKNGKGNTSKAPREKEIRLEDRPTEDLANQNTAKRLLSPPGLGRELSIPEAVEAFSTINDRLVSQEVLAQVAKMLILEKDGEKWKKLMGLKTKHPNGVFGLAEQLMFAFADMPRAASAAKLWLESYELREACLMETRALQKFTQMCDALITSKSVPVLLGMILTIGNYINAENIKGDSVGRQDGLSLDKCLDQCCQFKDNQTPSQYLARYIFHVFSRLKLDLFIQVMEDLSPLFSCVRRTVAAEGDQKKVFKEPVFVQKDMEKNIKSISQRFDTSRTGMDALLKDITNSSDPLKKGLPRLFEKAEKEKDELISLQEKADLKLKECKAYYCIGKDKTAEQFVLLWDDFFVSKEILLANYEDSKLKSWKAWIDCKEVYELDELLGLWGLPNVKMLQKERDRDDYD